MTAGLSKDLITADPGRQTIELSIDLVAITPGRGTTRIESLKLQDKRQRSCGSQCQYEKLDSRNQTIRDAAEMAALADRLGRKF